MVARDVDKVQAYILTRLAKTETLPHNMNTRNIYPHSTRLIIINIVMPTELSQYTPDINITTV